MKRLAVLLLALVLSSLSVAVTAAPTAPCPVTVHVSNSGALSVSSCKGVRKTTDGRLSRDLLRAMAQSGEAKPTVIFEAEDRAPLQLTMAAMNRIQDSDVYGFLVADGPDRPPFRIGMPMLPPNLIQPRMPGQAPAPREEPPGIFTVIIRADHRLDVDSYIGLSASAQARADVTADPEHPRHFSIDGVRPEDLAGLLPRARERDLANVMGERDAPWSEVRAAYRTLSAGGLGRLISYDTAAM